MRESESVRVGKRGAVVLPAAFRRRYGMDEGATLIAQATDKGILLRPAVLLPVEKYTTERKAEFLLNNAMDREDYEWALQEVRAMGIDPEQIVHSPPPE